MTDAPKCHGLMPACGMSRLSLGRLVETGQACRLLARLRHTSVGQIASAFKCYSIARTRSGRGGGPPVSQEPANVQRIPILGTAKAVALYSRPGLVLHRSSGS